MTCFCYALQLSRAVNLLRATCKDVAKDALPMRGTQLPLPPSTALWWSGLYAFYCAMIEWFVQTYLLLCLMKGWNIPANIDFDWFVVFCCNYKLLTNINNLLICKATFKWKRVCFFLVGLIYFRGRNLQLFCKLLCETSKSVLYVFRNVFFCNSKKLLNRDLTCRDLKEKGGGGGGRHSKEGPDG